MDVTVVDCPKCAAETVHDVAKERGREQVVVCRRCEHTHHHVAPRRVEVPVQVSRDDETTETEIAMSEGDTVQVGDRMFLLDGLAEVTAVEDADGRRPDRLVAEEIRTIWAKDIREIAIKVTMHHGRASSSMELERGPDETLTVGDVLDVEGRRVRIDRIKTEDGVLRRDGLTAEAIDVVRVYVEPAG